MAALDDVLPIYRHRERHERTIVAPPADVWSALLAVSANDLPLSRFLMGIRSIPGRLSGVDGSLDRSASQPVLATFLSRGFRQLRANPPRLLVAGAAIQPWRLVKGEVADVHDLDGFRGFNRPGFVLAAIAFELEAAHGGTRLATETRVQPTDHRAGRAFLPYWIAIRAGSGLIRRELMRAIARRAERNTVR
ncbi:MAG TPA: hypothetical protein VHO95_05510 [Candidatus Dormibacteraeota bacterium]|jgi:hypothetical protein|nr:hypothetical protein [Candidatus Dormibacteraeota bacterium]HEX2682225.1 hypothetical protein [Candidatus Dormibacteraeota bacterium]